MIHKDCGTPLMGDLSSGLRVMASLAFTRSGLKIVVGDVSFNESTLKEAFSSFYCPTCDRAVKNVEVLLLCFHCGKAIKLEEAWIPGNGGGIYCENHIKLFDDGDNATKISDCMKNLHF